MAKAACVTCTRCSGWPSTFIACATSRIWSTARRGIEALLGAKVYLDLHVKVAKDWQRDPKQLHRLGF